MAWSATRDPGIPRRAYFGSQGEHVGAVEGRAQRGHLVKDAAGRPDVSLLPVRLALQNLRAGWKQGC